MSQIKPKTGIVYECYKSITDEFGDRARKGQKFIYDGDDSASVDNGYYCFDKASGRGVTIAVPLDKFAAHFIPLQSETKKYTPKGYKEGDKVKIIACETKHQFPIGSIVTVVAINKTTGEINACKSDNGQFYFIDEESETAPYTEETTKPKFKVGDIVLISDDSRWYDITEANPANVEGVITEINDEDLGIIVKWNNGESNSYNERDLILVRAEQESYIDGIKLKDMNLTAITVSSTEQIKELAKVSFLKDQIEAAFPDLFVTHKVGNRYKHSDGNRYILTGENNHVALTNLKTGMIESYTVRVEDYNKITSDEFKQLCLDYKELTLIKERQ